MAERRDIGKFGPRMAMDLYEGTLTQTDVYGTEGKITKKVVPASPLAKGDHVKLYTSGSGDENDLLVTKCAAGDVEAIGIIAAEPKGTLPTTTTTWGNYTPRKATIEFFGTKIFDVTLEAANSEINVGKSVKLGASTVGTYDLYDATNLNATRALKYAAASSGSKIPVLFGFYGKFDHTF